ncbi:MAG: hypothetical protein AAF366_15575, partial [Pseudomonadota bacterium]
MNWGTTVITRIVIRDFIKFDGKSLLNHAPIEGPGRRWDGEAPIKRLAIRPSGRPTRHPITSPDYVGVHTYPAWEDKPIDEGL